MTSAAKASAARTLKKRSAAPKTCRRRNPKPQAPNPNEVASTKLQERLRTTRLEFGASLELGAWDLGFPPLRSRGRRRRRRHGRRSRRLERIEFHFRRFFGARRCVEKRPRLEAKHLVQHVGRKCSQRRVVFLDRGVEIISFHRDAVLGAFELRL